MKEKDTNSPDKNVPSIPRLRFPGFAGEWEEARIEDFVKYERPDAYSVKSEKYSDNFPTPVLTANKSFILGYTDEKEGIYAKCDALIFDDFTCSVKYVDFPFKVKSSAIKILTPSSKIPLRFIYGLLLHTAFKPHGHMRHWIALLQKLPVRIPKIGECEKIASFLTLIDKRIEVQRKLVEKLKIYKKGLLHKMFPNKESIFPELRLAGYSAPWKRCRLSDIVQIKMGQSPNGNTYSSTPTGYILVQGNADLHNGWVQPRIWTTQVTKIAQAGDLIMSVRAPAGVIGRTAYDAVIGRGVAAIKGNNFIYQLLTKMDFERYWRFFSCGTTFESLTSEDIKNAVISVPSEDEQHAIGEFLAKVDDFISAQQNKYNSLKQLKKGLLQQLFV